MFVTKAGGGDGGVPTQPTGSGPPPSGVQPPVGPFTTSSGAADANGRFFRDGDGLLTEKIHVTSSPDYGIGNMRWPYAGLSTGTWILRDCKTQNVSASPPRIMDGTGECGLWIGEKTQGSRLESWNSAWMEMVTLAAVPGSRFDNVDLHDNPHVGLYMEHPTNDVIFTNCSFGNPRLGTSTDSSSINVEWWYTDSVYGGLFPYGGRAGSFNCQFINCEIYCPPTSHPLVKGAFLDAGTFGFRFENCRFWGPGNALGFPNNLMNPSLPNQVVNCTFDNAGSQVVFHSNAIG